MPVAFMNLLTGPDRTVVGNRRLGQLLALVAGAVNAGGFLAVGRYTSHMTGLVSGVADDLALGRLALAGAGVLSICCFVGGAATTALLANWGRRHRLNSLFALPLLLEALLLLLFGVMGAHVHLAIDVVVPATVLLLCYLMGLQNAVVTKVSRAQIRTTHMTGILTDLGIELGRLLYWNKDARMKAEFSAKADRERLGIHASLLLAFCVGALTGAMAFQHFGYLSTVPLALVLALVASPPLLSDLQALRQLRR
ncbi:MAG: DUF1275 domain-containing protein [Roseateles depolymerans]|uniref:DUF1275 domain-containing protein n=1 Tax=Roseateles depolymerans TaxID=76731 RepID=A0A2W5FUG8_9BURK|nr:MAG: DUF1275 domain-containing protein [Roseateles depolymerans]